MLILFSKKGGGGGPTYTRVNATFSEELYSILSSVSKHSTVSYSIANDYVAPTWSYIEYDLVQTITVTTFSEEKWNILYSATTFSTESYDILSHAITWGTQSYLIINDRLNTKFSNIKYHLSTEATNYASEFYSITNDRTGTSWASESYDIRYSSSISSSFEILGPFETEHEVEYGLLTYNNIESEHEVIYALASSGIFGISERLLGCWDSWTEISSEINTHLHLYNTFNDSRNANYARYFVLHSDKNTYLERNLLKSERNTLFEYYTVYSSERNCHIGGYEIKYSDRNQATSAYQTNSSDRTTICLQLYSTGSERTSSFRCYPNDARIIFYKKWYHDERWAGTTYAIEKQVFVSQRFSWAQISDECFESIRWAGYEAYNAEFPIIVNPTYVEFATTIGASEIPIFENEKVVDVVNSMNTTPIDVHQESNDVIIISDNTEEDIIYTSGTSLSYINFERITGTDTFRYSGNIITIKETTFVKTSLVLSELNGYYDAESYLEDIIRTSIMKVEVAGIDMYEGNATVIDVPAFTKIPIVIQVHQSLLDQGNVNLSLKWAYPYNSLTINEIMLIGIYDE